MIPRGTIYISYSDILAGLWYTASHCFRKQKEVTPFEYDNTLVCLSVRTGFDLVLRALNLPPGSEILVTDINIPDMFSIIGAHDIKTVPLPVNKHTLHVSATDVEAAINPSTKAILLTHLFGSIMDIDELVHVARKHNLYIIEDCAQAYAGSYYQGHPNSDVIMFSFGFIKTNTALSGALLKINNQDLHSAVDLLNKQLPEQPSSKFFTKLLKGLLVKTLTYKAVYSCFYHLLMLIGKDFEKAISGFTKGFPARDLFKQIRYRPSQPNHRLVVRKLKMFDDKIITERAAYANAILKNVPASARIGNLNQKHTHWVIPVLVTHPDQFIAYLKEYGFDASKKASSLVKFTLPERKALPDELVLDNLVYLPVYPAMKFKTRSKLAQLVTAYLS